MKIINKKELTKMALDDSVEAFVMHVTFLLTMAIDQMKRLK